MIISFEIQYFTEWGESLTLVIGGKKYPMGWMYDGLWSITIDIEPSALEDYSYVVEKDGITVRIEWERHRSTPSKVIRDKWLECPIPGCVFPRKHLNYKFDDPSFRGAGTAIPVFSLRTKDDFGIGEFRDLHALVDWAKLTGQCIIQLLPVNDTTRKGEWGDSYPYSPISCYALNPMYIHLEDAGVKATKEFLKEKEELNSLEELDYPRVYLYKMKHLLKAFSQRGARDLRSREYAGFQKENHYWLDDYASFCERRDGTKSAFYKWLQFHLDKQFGQEVRYARSNGISFKGDLPIGVSADGTDAYYNPSLFNLDSSAGAPPDFFSKDGQNWGFPTYNWDNMALDGFLWWKKRLNNMSRYFDAFRIDHILGFFRIWEIPHEYTSGMYGHFNPALSYKTEEIEQMGLPFQNLFHEDPRRQGEWQPLISPDTGALEPWQKNKFNTLYNDFFFHRNNSFWEKGALKKLSELLAQTGMLACGEDLGMVPDCLPAVMDRLKILSLEMPMIEKGRNWPRLSVCTTSSHDMQTLRMQKEEDPSGEECRRIIESCLVSESMLAILPLQDWMSMDEDIRRKDRNAERINEPADPSHHWRYRMHICLEDLVSDKTSKLNGRIASLLEETHRKN